MTGPQQTMLELDSMDEKLRRLGLSSDATVDPLKGKSKEFSQAYMEKIRTDQKDRRRLRREKEYRRYMASDPYMQEGDRGAEAKLVQAAVDSARGLLEEEKAAAESVVRARDLKEMEEFDRAARLQKVVAIEKNIFEEAKLAAEESAARAEKDGVSISGMGPFSQLQVGDSTAKMLEKHETAVSLCQEVVHGLVELTFLVSDKRFLLAEELTGKPVRCVEQDLKVSEWNEWVQLCLHKTSTGRQDEGAVKDEQNSIQRAQSIHRDPDEIPEVRMATDQFNFAVRQEEKNEIKAQQDVMNSVTSMLRIEGKQLRKLALDDIRRSYDQSLEDVALHPDALAESEPGSPAFGTNSFAEGTPTLGQEPLAEKPSAGRIEVLPRWTHRMPSVCTFIHGDELSGVKLLIEAVERQVRHAGFRVTGEGEAPPPAPSGKGHDKNAAAVPSPEKSIGVVRVEEGFRKTYITPRTLLGRAHPSAIAPAAAGGRAAARHGGGGKGAPHHRLPAEDDERKDFEIMAETLAREIVAAHFHNLSLLTNGKVPPITAVQPQVDHTPRRAKANSKKEDTNAPLAEVARDETLHCLYLVGFPENESFYQILEMRLGPSIEAAEAEIAMEQHRLDEQAAALQAAAAAATPSRGRSHSTSQPPKPKAAPPAATGGGSSGRGKGSKGQVVEDTALLVAEQNSKKAFPPLCIIGYFVEYDIPARQRRLRDAYIQTGVPPSAPAPAVKGGPPPPPQAPVGISSSMLTHPVLNPEGSPPPPIVLTKESSFRIPNEKSISSAIKDTTAGNGGNGNFKSKKLSAAEWDIGVVRRELVQRDARMKRWQTQWQQALSGPTLASFKRSISSAAVPTPREKTKKKLTKTSGKETAAESPPETTNGKETFSFPKVLYFIRRELVNDFNVLACGGTQLEESDSSLPPFYLGNGKGHDKERMRTVEVLLQKVADSTRPGINPLSNAQLVPNLLPEPLRLNDYRLPNELLNDLLRTFNLYESKLLPEDRHLSSSLISSLFPAGGGTASADSKWPSASLTFQAPPTGRCTFMNLCSAEDEARLVEGMQKSCCLKAEMGVYRSFSLHLKDLLYLVAGEAFPDSIWESTTDFSSTVHYVSIDKNFAELQDRVRELDRAHRQQLQWWCAVLFCYVVNDAIELTATAMENVYQWIQRAYFPVEGATQTLAVSAMSTTSPSITPNIPQGVPNPSSKIGFSIANPITEPEMPLSPQTEQEFSEDCTTLPNHPAPPPTRAICDPKFRLSQEQTLEFLAPLFSRSETGVASFWEGFRVYLDQIQSVLEKELSEHIKYFAVHQEFHRQLQAVPPSVLLPAAGSTTSVPHSATPKKAGKELSPRKGKENTVAEISQKGTPTTSSTTILTSGTFTKHTDPISELQWELYVPQLVKLVLSRLFATGEPLPEDIPCGLTTPTAVQGEGIKSCGFSTYDSQCIPSDYNSHHAADGPIEGSTHVWNDASGAFMAHPSELDGIPQTILEEVQHAVSPSLCRSVVLIKEVIRCVDSASQCAQKWLEVMYRTALATPTDSAYPAEVRPTTLAQLFTVPMVSAESGASDGLPPCDRGVTLDYDWPRLNLELTLCTLSIYGRRQLSLDEFLHCAVLAQLSKMWIFLEDGISDLPERIGFQQPAAVHVAPSPSMDSNEMENASTPGTKQQLRVCLDSPRVAECVLHLPDLLFASAFLSAPCREAAHRQLPFLHLSELRTLFYNNVTVGPEQRKKDAQLDLREWLVKMIAHRCCFCQATSCPYLCRESLALPSLRELRHAVSNLPDSILRNSSAVSLVPPYVSKKVKDGFQVRDQGVKIDWWEYEGNGVPELNMAMRRSLTRITTASFFLSSVGVLRREFPPLPLVLHLLSNNHVSMKESICRIFHCVAAVMVKSPEPQRFFEAGGSSSLAVNDVRLTVEEFVHFFGWRNDSNGRRAGSDALSLAVDAQLLLQVEERQKISVGMLLSSHWGRALVSAHLSS